MAFDFKGNALASERQLADDYETTPDWLALASLTGTAAIETVAPRAVAPYLHSPNAIEGPRK